MFQTFAVEVLNSFLARRECCRGADDADNRMYINQGKVREQDSFPYYIASTLHLQDPHKAPHLGSSGDGVILWGLEEACRALAWKVG